MGYYITVREMIFQIKEENFAPALEAIKELEGHGWVDSKYKTTVSLREAMIAWRWDPAIDDDTGDINYLYFEGEKLGDDERFFDALAPFVEEGSYIEVSGEESALWRWCFDGKKMTEKFANISWE
jgi:hypothetical protein